MGIAAITATPVATVGAATDVESPSPRSAPNLRDTSPGRFETQAPSAAQELAQRPIDMGGGGSSGGSDDW